MPEGAEKSYQLTKTRAKTARVITAPDNKELRTIWIVFQSGKKEKKERNEIE